MDEPIRENVGLELNKCFSPKTCTCSMLVCWVEHSLTYKASIDFIHKVNSTKRTKSHRTLAPLSGRSSVNCWTTWSHIDHCRFRNPFLFQIDQAFCSLGCFNISAFKVLQRVSVWSRNSCSEINGFLKRNYKLCAVIQMLLTKPPRLWVSSLEALRVPRRSNRRFNLYATSVSLSHLSFVESFGDWRG